MISSRAYKTIRYHFLYLMMALLLYGEIIIVRLSITVAIISIVSLYKEITSIKDHAEFILKKRVMKAKPTRRKSKNWWWWWYFVVIFFCCCLFVLKYS